MQHIGQARQLDVIGRWARFVADVGEHRLAIGRHLIRRRERIIDLCDVLAVLDPLQCTGDRGLVGIVVDAPGVGHQDEPCGDATVLAEPLLEQLRRSR